MECNFFYSISSEYVQQFSTEYVTGNCTYLLFKVRFVTWFMYSPFNGASVVNLLFISMIMFAV